MLDFHQLDNTAKSELKQRGMSQVRGRAGVDFGMPATLLDAANIVCDAWKLISEKTVRNSFIKADLKMNLVTEVEEPLLFDGLIKGFSKINIDLEENDINNFVTIDNETTEEYSESVLEEVEAANSEVDSTNMPGTSKDHLESDEEYFSEQEEEFEFEGFKPILMKTISINTQLFSSKAVTGAGEHYEELKATCEKFQRLLCKASVTEEELKLKKNVN